ncbi:YesL family protein [Bacillus sp. PS06]|uniref:YesL family protein n=1 Tax=Bacillus sp. PS06 TaxID=2764176 RepID=UPI00177C44EF|nr:YesL family protein [Bacillus sp. PS06]MBD8071042.1 YesL family protein [Bacillus sp. PS06]
MQTSGLMGGFYKITLIISRLAYVNLLWTIFTLAGLVVFGLFPATTAMFAVTRKWVMGEDDIPVFKTFWQSYKSEFLKSNLIGLILIVIGFILFIDIRFFQSPDIGFFAILFIPLLVVSVIFLLISLYVFPILVHFDINIRQVLKNSFLVMALNPLLTIMMSVSILAYFFILFKIPGLTLFFTGSVTAYIIMWFANHAFQKVQQKQQTFFAKKENV